MTQGFPPFSVLGTLASAFPRPRGACPTFSVTAPLAQLSDPGWRTGGQEVWEKSGPGSPWQRGTWEPFACPSPTQQAMERLRHCPYFPSTSFLSLHPEQVVSCPAPGPGFPRLRIPAPFLAPYQHVTQLCRPSHFQPGPQNQTGVQISAPPLTGCAANFCASRRAVVSVTGPRELRSRTLRQESDAAWAQVLAEEAGNTRRRTGRGAGVSAVSSAVSTAVSTAGLPE